jgi:hypothetical protein
VLKHGIFMCSIVIMVFFAILGGYVLTSVLFFKYPNLIHKRKQLKFKCRHISHRGGESAMDINVNIAEHRMKTCVARRLKFAALLLLLLYIYLFQNPFDPDTGCKFHKPLDID